MTSGTFESWKSLLSKERLPAAIVDLDAFDRNARKLAEAARGKPIRLATKSLRVPALIRRALEMPASPFRGLMCYSAEEALRLADSGFDDFLVAYPTLQRSDFEILRALHTRADRRRVSLVVDSVEGVKKVADAMSAGGSPPHPFPVVIEVDMALKPLGGRAHLGVLRSPIRTPSELKDVLVEVRRNPELQALGMMAYEAQVAGLGDRNPFKRLLNPIAAWVRRRSAVEIRSRRVQLARAFRESEGSLPLFNGGGTGSLTFACGESDLTELAAGSGLYCPHLFDYYSNLALEPAAFFALQAVREPRPGFVTCQGGGYVASGEPGWDKVPRPYLPQGLKLIGAEGCGEVQTPLDARKASSPVRAGDPVLFRHAKAGELMERFNEVLLVSGGKIMDRVPTYRGKGWSFF